VTPSSLRRPSTSCSARRLSHARIARCLALYEVHKASPSLGGVLITATSSWPAVSKHSEMFRSFFSCKNLLQHDQDIKLAHSYGTQRNHITLTGCTGATIRCPLACTSEAPST
jgi:hypothetical protein